MTVDTGAPSSSRQSAGWSASGWRRWTTPYDVSHPDAAAFRSLQIQATIALTPWAVFANWANVLVAGWTFRHSADWRIVFAWMLGTAVYSATGVPAWRRWRRGRWPARVSRRTLTRASRHAVVLALLWGLPVALIYPVAAVEDRPLVVGITIGMICAGGFALRCPARRSATWRCCRAGWPPHSPAPACRRNSCRPACWSATPASSSPPS